MRGNLWWVLVVFIVGLASGCAPAEAATGEATQAAPKAAECDPDAKRAVEAQTPWWVVLPALWDGKQCREADSPSCIVAKVRTEHVCHVMRNAFFGDTGGKWDVACVRAVD